MTAPKPAPTALIAVPEPLSDANVIRLATLLYMDPDLLARTWEEHIDIARRVLSSANAAGVPLVLVEPGAVRPVEQSTAGIRPVTYYEPWCGEGGDEHLIETGDFTGWRQSSGAIDEVADNDGVVLPDGRVYCADHIPTDVCAVADDHQHRPADDDPTECSECSATLPAATAPAVTA